MAALNPSSGAAPPIPDDDNADEAQPLPMSASVMLSALPKDAKAALEQIDLGDKKKVKVNFRAIGSAPQLSRKVAQVSASNRFETVVSFLRRRLGVRPEDSVICYINQVFAPGLDETVGGLFNVNTSVIRTSGYADPIFLTQQSVSALAPELSSN